MDPGSVGPSRLFHDAEEDAKAMVMTETVYRRHMKIGGQLRCCNVTVSHYSRLLFVFCLFVVVFFFAFFVLLLLLFVTQPTS